MMPSNDRARETVVSIYSAQRHYLDSSGGGSGDMEGRVTRLETHMEYVRRDLDEIKDAQTKVLDRLAELPTRSDLRDWRWQWIATGLAIVALTVGGITGGLALIARYAG